MKSLTFIIISATVVAAFQANEEDIKAVECDPRSELAAELFPQPIPKERAKLVLRRAIELIDGDGNSFMTKRQRLSGDGHNIEQEARNLLRFLIDDDDVLSSQSTMQGAVSQDSDYDDARIITIPGSKRRVRIETLEKIRVLRREKGQSERAIQGKYRWFHRMWLQRYEEYLATGNVRFKQAEIDKIVWKKVSDALDARRPIHDYLIRRWAQDAAASINATSFTASNGWLSNFKNRHNLVSRKVTKYISRAEQANEDRIEENLLHFREQYSALRDIYPPHLIMNMDQSNFNYEISNLRTIARRGDRDIVLELDSRNRNTHSYTVQPLITRDGNIAGRLLICLQEDSGRFGPRVEQQVRRLEQTFGNIRVVASKSGKMSAELIEKWADELLVPAYKQRMRECDGETLTQSSQTSTVCRDDEVGPSWALQPDDQLTEEQRAILRIRNASHTYIRRPDLLLLVDSWGGHSSERLEGYLRERRVHTLKIPPHTTGELQPLDVNFFRQYKKFVKRIVEEALYQGMIGNVTSREGVIRMHSLIWDQFSSPSYHDMIRYAWRNTDPLFSNDELVDGPPPRMVSDIQFNLNSSSRCSIDGCNNTAFIRCSHDGHQLCLQHFLEGKHFHHNATGDSEMSTTTDNTMTNTTITSTTEQPPLTDDYAGESYPSIRWTDLLWPFAKGLPRPGGSFHDDEEPKERV